MAFRAEISEEKVGEAIYPLPSQTSEVPAFYASKWEWRRRKRLGKVDLHENREPERRV